MITVDHNIERGCNVVESEIPDWTKFMVYPKLAEMELQANKILCSVKEMVTLLFSRPYFVKAMQSVDPCLPDEICTGVGEHIEEYLKEVNSNNISLMSRIKDLINDTKDRVDNHRNNFEFSERVESFATESHEFGKKLRSRQSKKKLLAFSEHLATTLIQKRKPQRLDFKNQENTKYPVEEEELEERDYIQMVSAELPELKPKPDPTANYEVALKIK